MNRAATDDEIMRIIAEYFRKHGYAPSYRDIGNAFGYKSSASIQSRIDKLYIKGMIETDEDYSSPRAFRIAPKYAEKYGGVIYEGL